jgi:hypothetical protein
MDGQGGADTPFIQSPPPPRQVERRREHSYDGGRVRLKAAEDNLLTACSPPRQQWLERVLSCHRWASLQG